CVDQHGRATTGPATLDEHRAAQSPVLGIVRIACAPVHADARHAAGRSATQDRAPIRHAAAEPSVAPDTAVGRLDFAYSLKKFSVVACASASGDTPLTSASTAAVFDTYAGSLRFPR